MPPKHIQTFEFPLGVRITERTNFRQREGYEVDYLKDDEIPRYRYALVLSADRLAEAVDYALSKMPGQISVIVEETKMNHGKPTVEVWASQEMDKSIVREVWADNVRLFTHDGMVGFGAACFDLGAEIFLDCHKVLYIHSPQMEFAECIVNHLGLRYFKRLPHISELGYEPVSLRDLGMEDDYHEVIEELRTELGLDLAEVREE